MMFKIGDRVIYKARGWTGTVTDVSEVPIGLLEIKRDDGEVGSGNYGNWRGDVRNWTIISEDTFNPAVRQAINQAVKELQE